MGALTNQTELSSDDFARRFALRPGQLMWLLGAGASVSAGIPSAWDMIWQFKQTLFVAQRKASPQSVADLGNPAIRALLDSHIASSEQLPPPGSPDEYAALFEATYPAERDRTGLVTVLRRSPISLRDLGLKGERADAPQI